MSKARKELNAHMASGTPVLVKFGASWCGPCKVLAPTFKAAKEKTEVAFIDIDVDEDGDLASEFGIRGVPAMFFIKDGVKSDPLIGVHTEAEILEYIK